MRIFVINPNSSADFSGYIRETMQKGKRPDCEITVVNPSHGPAMTENALDDLTATGNIIDLIKQANAEKYDAIILACFSDPGLDAAKELSMIPVVGFEEATLHLAAMLGHRFSILVKSSRRIPTRELHVRMLGLEQSYASSVALNVTSSDPNAIANRILEAAREAVDQHHAEVIVMGCVSLAKYAPMIEETLGVSVLDPCLVSLKVAETFVDLGLRQSKRLRYACPTK